MIDPTAIVHETAKIAPNVRIGPFSIIGADVEIDEATEIGAHVLINGPTKIGKNNHIYPFAVLGVDPQDKKYRGGLSVLEIEDNNTFREFVTISRGTEVGGGITRIGSHNLFMAYVHIAHDCLVGDHVIFSNNASLAGHVRVEHHANLGGFVGVRQFCWIGEHSLCAGGSIVVKDVPPYVVVSGHPAHARGLNSIGLRRNGFSEAVYLQLKQAYRILYRTPVRTIEAIELLAQLEPGFPEVANLRRFLEKSERGITR